MMGRTNDESPLICERKSKPKGYRKALWFLCAPLGFSQRWIVLGF